MATAHCGVIHDDTHTAALGLRTLRSWVGASVGKKEELGQNMREFRCFGGAGGIRTLDRALQPYNGLANRRLQPLGHSSINADMPDARACRKRQIQIVPRPFGGSGALRAFLANGRYPVSRVWAHVSGLRGPW